MKDLFFPKGTVATLKCSASLSCHLHWTWINYTVMFKISLTRAHTSKTCVLNHGGVFFSIQTILQTATSNNYIMPPWRMSAYVQTCACHIGACVGNLISALWDPYFPRNLQNKPIAAKVNWSFRLVVSSPLSLSYKTC